MATEKALTRHWQDNVDKRLLWLFAGLGALIIPFIAYISNEVINRGDFSGLFVFIDTHPKVFVLGYIVYLIIFLFLYAVIGRSKPTVILYSVLFFAIGVAQHYKMLLRGEPLMLRDVFATGEAAGILSGFTLELSESLVISFALLALQIILSFFMPYKNPVNVHIRIAIIAVLMVFSAEGTQYLWKNSKSNVFAAYYVHWSPVQNYDYNGMAVSLLFTGQSFVVQAPENYDKQHAQEALASADASSYEPENLHLSQKPHIIAIMGEAFSDLRVLNDNLVFNDDPFAPIDTAPGYLYRGNLAVSVFGGSTAVSEFEFLTSYSQRGFPSGSIAYQHYFSKEQSSLVSVLEEHGYDSIVMHQNDGNLYSRRVAYTSMGFNRFTDIKGFTTPRYRNLYMTDASLAKVMAQKFRDRDPDKPMFMFSITIENHSPYNREVEGDAPYDFDASTVEGISEDGLLGINTHSTGVKHTSEMVREFMDYFADFEEPVMIVLFGDHLPRVDIPQIPVKTDDVNNEAALLLKNYYTTPYYIWTNYEVDMSYMPEMTSPNFLAPYVLKAAGLEAPRYLKKVYDASLQMQGFTDKYTLDKEGVLKVSDSESDEDAQTLNELLLLQYDMLFGSQYTKNRLWNVPSQ